MRARGQARRVRPPRLVFVQHVQVPHHRHLHHHHRHPSTVKIQNYRWRITARASLPCTSNYCKVTNTVDGCNRCVASRCRLSLLTHLSWLDFRCRLETSSEFSLITPMAARAFRVLHHFAVSMLSLLDCLRAVTNSPIPLAWCGALVSGNKRARSQKASRQALSSRFFCGTTAVEILRSPIPQRPAAATFCTDQKSCFPCERHFTQFGMWPETERTSGAHAVSP